MFLSDISLFFFFFPDVTLGDVQKNKNKNKKQEYLEIWLVCELDVKERGEKKSAQTQEHTVPVSSEL